jgi:hypothetical protein
MIIIISRARKLADDTLFFSAKEINKEKTKAKKQNEKIREMKVMRNVFFYRGELKSLLSFSFSFVYSENPLVFSIHLVFMYGSG